jgi:hypothetical protein
VVIEAEGIKFLAPRAQLSLVAGLQLGVEESFGREVLVVSHPLLDPGEGC